MTEQQVISTIQRYVFLYILHLTTFDRCVTDIIKCLELLLNPIPYMDNKHITPARKCEAVFQKIKRPNNFHMLANNVNHIVIIDRNINKIKNLDHTN